MPSTGNHTIDIVLCCIIAAVLLFIGYRAGRFLGAVAQSKAIATKEQELFTSQKSFKQLYEQEIATHKSEAAELHQKIQTLEARVEEYRKKAAGFGGLFSTGGKRADAMYALLLENESLEEALYAQNEKLRQERTDTLKEQMRATGYRRVLISQLLNDERIKGYVNEILNDERRLPGTNGAGESKALPVPASSGPVQGQVAD